MRPHLVLKYLRATIDEQGWGAKKQKGVEWKFKLTSKKLVIFSSIRALEILMSVSWSVCFYKKIFFMLGDQLNRPLYRWSKCIDRANV